MVVRLNSAQGRPAQSSSRRPRLGIIVQDLVLFADTQELIRNLSGLFDVVLYAERPELETDLGRFEMRRIAGHERTGMDRALAAAFQAAGNKPSDRDSYANWKRRNIAGLGTLPRLKESGLLAVSGFLPELLDFETYLARVSPDTTTRIDDVDCFLSFTDVRYVHLCAGILRAGKPLLTYVYSWDHPAKYYNFAKSGIHYLTWNNEVKYDLVELHNIQPDNITPVGSTQLGVVQEFVSRNPGKRPYDFEYVYFPAACGNDALVEQEVRLVEHASIVLKSIDPDMKLVFRPYPRAHSGGCGVNPARFYDCLLALDNVHFDTYGRAPAGTPLTEEGAFDKLNHVAHARALLHIGTTVGLESSYLSTPIVYLDLRDFDFGRPASDPMHMFQLQHTYHHKKYMQLYDHVNVVTQSADLPGVLTRAIREPGSMLPYNRAKSRLTPLYSHADVAENFAHAIREVLATSGSYGREQQSTLDKVLASD